MIGHQEYNIKHTEDPTLGIASTNDECLLRVDKAGLRLLHSFEVKNKGKGNATITIKKRGMEYTIAAEVLTALQVGATDRFRGPLTKRRVKPGSVVILDSNVVVVQRVEDTNGDGILWQTDGPVGVTYPKEVGKINYHTGWIDYVFENAVTAPVVGDYKHSDWSPFAAPISLAVVAGGGHRTFIIKPDNAAAFLAGVKEESEIGIFGKLDVDQVPTTVGVLVYYAGPQDDMQLPLVKGEIRDYPYHNA